MKKVVSVAEVSGGGLEALLGERVTLYCLNYIYTGNLSGVNTTDVLLTDAYIVYDTGAYDKKEWQDAQRLGDEWRVRVSAIESYGLLK